MYTNVLLSLSAQKLLSTDLSIVNMIAVITMAVGGYEGMCMLIDCTYIQLHPPLVAQKLLLLYKQWN